MLVHSGSADGGHYYSFIKERDSRKWLEFNDTQVKPFDIKDLPAECFGGDSDARTGRAGNVFYPADFITERMWEKCRNAYLLFYHRVHPLPGAHDKVEDGERFVNGIPTSVYQHIWDENMSFLKRRYFYEPDYFSFMKDLVALYNFERAVYIKANASDTRKIEYLRYLTNFYFKNLRSFGHEQPDVVVNAAVEDLELTAEPM